MKKGLFNKVKYIVNSFTFYGKGFVRDISNVIYPTICDANGVRNLLKSTASVKDMQAIDSALKGVYNFDGKLHNVMCSDEYKRYDDTINLNEIIYFCGSKNKISYLNDEELNKAFKVLHAVSNLSKKHLMAYCIVNSLGKYQYFIYITEGKNGYGDFVDDDMKSVIKYLDAIKEAGATWRSVTNMLNDIVDDVSDWVITFTVD